MPEKLGNGGHSYEKYDPETGKYVEDGKPNKYYDNPKEKTLSNSSKIDLLKEKFPDFFAQDREQDEELNARFANNKNQEKYTKPILEMSREELNREIQEHYEYLKSLNIDMTNFADCFNYDLQLKCANFRQMYKMMEKYSLKLQNCAFVSSHVLGEYTTAGMEYILNYDKGFVPNIGLHFNIKKFQSYQSVVENQINQAAVLKWHPLCETEKYAVTDFNHEFGHAILNDYTKKINIFSREKIDNLYNVMLNKILNNESSEVKIVSSSRDSISIMYKDELYHGNKSVYLKILTKQLVYEELKKELLWQREQIKKEVFSVFVEQNPNIIDKKKAFEEDFSGYAERNKNDPHEWFAETFASLEGGKPTKSALALKEWLKRKGYLKGE